MQTQTIQLYENRTDVTLTAYILDDSGEMLKGRKRPAILVCPGGAYVFCSDREAEPVALRFAAMGYHAFVLRYSVYNKGVMVDPRGELPVDPDSQYPNAMCDAAAAMLCIRDHSDDWLVDADRIFLSGYSAGAHNAAMFCTHWNDPLILERFGRPSSDFKPAGAVLGYGYYDWGRLREVSSQDEMARMMGEGVDMSYFGTRTPSKEQYAAASPALAVTADTPPMFLWTTCGDRTLPSEQSMLMGCALARAGIPYELHIFESGDHGLALADQASAGNPEQINDDVAGWISLAQRWLTRHFPLDIPEAQGGNPFA